MHFTTQTRDMPRSAFTLAQADDQHEFTKCARTKLDLCNASKQGTKSIQREDGYLDQT